MDSDEDAFRPWRRVPARTVVEIIAEVAGWVGFLVLLGSMIWGWADESGPYSVHALLGCALYLFVTVAERLPQLWHFPEGTSERDIVSQYHDGRSMFIWSKTAVIWIFVAQSCGPGGSLSGAPRELRLAVTALAVVLVAVSFAKVFIHTVRVHRS